jgi:hypothetical protein
MPYLCMVRSDIPNGTLQVLDLETNTSQRNLTIDPPGQTKYINRLVNDTVAVTANVTAAPYTGLAAYLIDTVEDTGDAGALTAAQANTIAAALIAHLDAGGVMSQANVNLIIQATVPASGIGIGGSVATLAGLLQVLAGAPYFLPAGTPANPAAAQYKGAAAGQFPAGTYRATYESGSLTISLGEGDLSVFTDPAFSYAGTTGAAVVVYADDGSLLS